jgi:hypothetical protein
MDPRLFDAAWEVHRTVRSGEPFHVVSAYRSPGTNSMLRRRSRGVAKHSQHTLGKAMDFYLPDTPTARIREAGMRLQRGGVGFYPGAHTPFIHLDAGSVRSWPRMTRDQLVRLFPDEKTVHLPADGKPLGGYEIAKAEILSGGGSVMGYATADLDEGAIISSGRKSLWAALFGGDDEEADARPTRGRRAAPTPQPTVLAYADGNASDGGRFATVQQPAPVPEATGSRLIRERSGRRAAPQPAEPAAEPVQVAALAPAPAAAPPPVPPAPAAIDVPLPAARPARLPQLASAALPEAASGYAPAGEAPAADRLILASLPPRRPGELAALPGLPVMAGQPVDAPLPPLRPLALAGLPAETLRGGTSALAPAPVPEGKLVTVSHPPPPQRPDRPAVASAPAPAIQQAAAPRAPTAAHYQSDRDGLDALFRTVAGPPATGKTVSVATARTRATTPPGWNVGPSPAASLGFGGAEATDAQTGRFSGPAVRPLPTTFTQN